VSQITPTRIYETSMWVLLVRPMRWLMVYVVFRLCAFSKPH